MQFTRSSAAVAVAVLALLTACERKQSPDASAQSSTQPSAQQNDAAGKPSAGVQALQKIDTVQGTGAEAKAGATVIVNYTGWLYVPTAPDKHGEKFDSSIGRQPFSFRLGAGGVIPGWDQGVEGMKVGGKRTLVIPAALGYGPDGAGPIPPNADLIFDVELLGVE